MYAKSLLGPGGQHGRAAVTHIQRASTYLQRYQQDSKEFFSFSSKFLMEWQRYLAGIDLFNLMLRFIFEITRNNFPLDIVCPVVYAIFIP